MTGFVALLGLKITGLPAVHQAFSDLPLLRNLNLKITPPKLLPIPLFPAFMTLKPQLADVFEARHNAPGAEAQAAMLRTIGVESLEQLIAETVPPAIRLKKPLDLPAALSERAFLAKFKQIAGQNQVFKSYIGLGYHDTTLPPVIQRNILENPGWYTAYTPYQAEIAQGRLEALINYQTMIIDLTGMEIANASLLD